MSHKKWTLRCTALIKTHWCGLCIEHEAGSGAHGSCSCHYIFTSNKVSKKATYRRVVANCCEDILAVCLSSLCCHCKHSHRLYLSLHGHITSCMLWLCECLCPLVPMCQYQYVFAWMWRRHTSGYSDWLLALTNNGGKVWDGGDSLR